MLDEANLQIAQLNNRDWRSAILIDRLSKRHNDYISLLRTVAQEQIQRQDELHNLRALSATAEMSIQHERELHKGTKESLEHEREVTSKLTDYLIHLPVFMSTGTESTISENFSVMEQRNLDLELRIKQMEKDSQAKDVLVRRLQTTCEQLMEERDDIIAARACSV